MLDMPLEAALIKFTEISLTGFNPSYAGYASGRNIRILGTRNQKLFQSFLCWICLWKWSRSLIACSKFEFQSFLCWICLWKVRYRTLRGCLRKVSILLMLDMPLEDQDASMIYSLRKGFNPSYAGYASGSDFERQAAGDRCLVSILLMLDMPLEVLCRFFNVTANILFQSFLCWICLWKENHIRRQGFVEVFQSFLCWICLWKIQLEL